MGAGVSRDGLALLAAAKRGDADAVCAALKDGGPRIASARTLLQSRSVLHIAAREGRPEVVRAVVAPLVAAARAEIAAWRAAAAAGTPVPEPGPALDALRRTVNARDSTGRTPLHLAAKRGHLCCVKELARSCAANVFVLDHAGCTCLHVAALRGHADVIAYVLDLMTDDDDERRVRLVNKRCVSGFSALSYATWRGCEATVRLLLRHGADAAVVNEQVFDPYLPLPLGSTPLHIAATRGNEAVSFALLEHYALARVHTPRGRRPPHDPRHGANVHGHTPAALAAHQGRMRLAEALMPGVPVGHVVDVAELIRRRGPPPLREIAGDAWRRHLLARLDDLDEALSPLEALELGACCGGGGDGSLDCHSAGTAGVAGGGGGGGGGCAAPTPPPPPQPCWAPSSTVESSLGGAPTSSDDGRLSRAGSGADSGPSSSISDGTVSGGSDDGAAARWCGRCGGCDAACSGGGCLASQSSLDSSLDETEGFWYFGSNGGGVGSSGAPLWQQASACGGCACAAAAAAPPPPAPCPRGPCDSDSDGGCSSGGAGGGCRGNRMSCDGASSCSGGGVFCGVCYESPPAALQLRGCGHRLCAGCARGVVERQAAGASPPMCPFCRRPIAGFDLALPDPDLG